MQETGEQDHMIRCNKIYIFFFFCVHKFLLYVVNCLFKLFGGNVLQLFILNTGCAIFHKGDDTSFTPTITFFASLSYLSLHMFATSSASSLQEGLL